MNIDREIDESIQLLRNVRLNEPRGTEGRYFELNDNLTICARSLFRKRVDDDDDVAILIVMTFVGEIKFALSSRCSAAVEHENSCLEKIHDSPLHNSDYQQELAVAPPLGVSLKLGVFVLK